jgi:ABC-type antimicrobial peptide transport system permease subunit
MAFYLALKEIWRYRGRFLLFSLVIALITALVLFVAALASGLATANRQFLDKLDADVLVYQADVDLQATSSRLNIARLKAVRRLDQVVAAGPLAFSTTKIVLADGRQPIDVSLIGVQPGQPGDAPLLQGSGFRADGRNEVIVDDVLAKETGLKLGDTLTVRSNQGTDEKSFSLKVVGISDERKYFFQPSIIVPLETWDKVRPQPAVVNAPQELIFNMIAVKLKNPQDISAASQSINQRVDGVEVADKETAILAIPGYTAQQNTLNTQQGFSLLIGVLVVGGFFQIQTMQKVAQIGMLKAIGSPNRTVALEALLQIVFVTVTGVLIGGLGTLLLAFGMPGNVPILFTGSSVFTAIAALLLIGPIGGLVSIRLALKIDPLNAIGLSS